MRILQLPYALGILFVVYFIYIKLSDKKIKWLLLWILSLSCMIYMEVNTIALIIMYIAIIINWCATFIMNYYEKINNKKKKKIVAGITISIDIGLLFGVKDLNFFIGTLRAMCHFIGQSYEIDKVDLLTTFGISIYTLLLIGYIIDVYNDKVQMERNPLKLFLFASFYPVLFCGPIIRFSEVKGELFEPKKYSYDNFYNGIQRIALGVFKKIMIADKLGIIVDAIYSDTVTYSGAYIWIASIFFTIQLYSEFSGYIDIVLGVSRLFGIILPENFDRPFSARNIEEFWKRWNITLNTWANDYILEPIIKSKQSFRFEKYFLHIKKYFGLFLMWFFIGLWYGNSWNYVFGLGIFTYMMLLINEILNPVYIKIRKVLKVNTKNYFYIKFQQIRTFIIITISFLFFRSYDGLMMGFYFIKNMFVEFRPSIIIDGSLMKLGLDERQILILIISLFVLFLEEDLKCNNDKKKIILVLQSIIIFTNSYKLCYLLFEEGIGENGQFYLIILSSIFAMYNVVYRYREKYINSLIIFLLGAPICLLAFEILSQNWPFIRMEVDYGKLLFNLPFYYIVFVFMKVLISNSRKACIISTILIGGLGLINHYIVRFRGTAISPFDIRSWKIGMNLLGNYKFTVNELMVIAFLFFIAYIILVSTISFNIIESSRREKYVFRIVSFVLIGNIIVLYNTDILKNNNIKVDWDGALYNGSVLNFFVELKESKMPKPTGYSEKVVADLLENTSYVSLNDAPITKPVHIIAIMNESFSDFSEWKDLKLSEDPAPFLHSLSKNTIKGNLFVPAFGGGTANSEFEFLTNSSISCLPVGAIPYYTYMKNNIPSLVSQLKNQNYMTVGYHPSYGRNYNRDVVYQYLGFDKVSLGHEDKEGFKHELLRWFVSDQSDFSNLKRLSEASGDQPLFIFNVTIQNHGGYFMNWPDLQETIHLTGNLKGKYPDVTQYFSLIRETDKALEDLITYYSESDIPTMVIFFGDHKPLLDNAYYEEINGSEIDTIEEKIKMHATPFFIWTNYDIPEQENINISSWGLGILAMKIAGVPLTDYQEFLYSLMQKLPVITPLGFITNNGDIIPKDQISEYKEYNELYNQYNYLTYNVLFDKNRKDEYFFGK